MLKEGREVIEGEFQTACSNALFNGSYDFGDINVKESPIAKLVDRMYHLLEHRN
jgi:molybdopterin-containing oxidoreductase family iron-sulfur binding subunit